MNNTSQPISIKSDSTASFKSLSKGISLFVIGIGCLVLAGWALDIPAIKSILPGLATMKSMTASLFVLCGISLWLQVTERTRRVAQICAFIVAFVGLLTLGEYLFHSDFSHIDQLPFPDMGGGLFPGRMAPSTSVNFLIIGITLLFLDNWSGARFKQTSVIATFAISLLALIGYLYEVSSLYKISIYTSMAVHTATSFILLSLGILFARPERGLMKTILADTAGGTILRRFLPLVMVLPPVLGWVRLQGQRAGLYDTAFGLAIMVTSLIAMLITFIWINAGQLTRLDIKRSQIEQASIERERKLAKLFELLPVGISILNEDRKVSYTNPALKKILGMSEEGLLQGAYRNRKYLRGDGSPMSLEEMPSTRVFKEKRDVNDLEIGVIKEDEGIIWTRVSALPVDFPDWKVVIVTSNITEHKQAEEMNAYLAALVNSSEDAIISKDLHSTVTSWNTGAQKVFGYTANEMIGQSILRLIPAERKQEEEQILNQISQGKSINHFETVRITKDGRHVDVSVTVSPIKDTTGKIVGASKVARDITERKQSDEELRTNERRLHLAASAGGVGIWDWDILKDELIWDESMYSLYGIHEKDFSGAYHAWTSTLHPDDRLFTEDEIQAALRGEREYAPEFRIVRPDGVVRVIKATSQTIHDPNGKALRMIGTNIDITERKQAEKEIFKLNAGLETKVAERTAELAIANKQLHELTIIDELTSLYNRRGFLLHAEQQLLLAQRTKRNLLIFYADLDGLKQINDHFGHASGDEAIVRAARALDTTFRTSDIKARLGGDEFAVLVVEAKVHDAQMLLDRLRKQLTENNQSMSIGVISFDAKNDVSIDELIARADKAMYAEKRNKPNRRKV